MKRNLNLFLGICLAAAAQLSCTKEDLDVVLPEEPSEQGESSLSGSGSTDDNGGTSSGETITAYSQSSGSLSVKGNTYLSNTSDVNSVKVSGGTINATNLTITTESETSSLIATDRGGGTVTVDGGKYTAKGKLQ